MQMQSNKAVNVDASFKHELVHAVIELRGVCLDTFTVFLKKNVFFFCNARLTTS